MSISGVTAPPRVTPANLDSPAADAPLRHGGSVPEVEIDQVTQLPMPPRFPWLSRLSQALESTAKQKPTFPSAPVLGDNVNRSA
jgi:hypothetical protein